MRDLNPTGTIYLCFEGTLNVQMSARIYLSVCYVPRLSAPFETCFLNWLMCRRICTGDGHGCTPSKLFVNFGCASRFSLQYPAIPLNSVICLIFVNRFDAAEFL